MSTDNATHDGSPAALSGPEGPRFEAAGALDAPAAPIAPVADVLADGVIAERTYRDRRQARAERLVEWAGKRQASADTAYAKASQMADAIPFGQPVMGARDRRYRDRIGASMSRSVEHANMAEAHRRRAGTITSQLGSSIYSDDHDAAEALAARIASLEARRARLKSYNASCRKGARDVSVLTPEEQAEIVGIVRVAAWQCKGGAFPAYVLSNLSANIKRNRDRLELLHPNHG